jgi:hypothetical protein
MFLWPSYLSCHTHKRPWYGPQFVPIMPSLWKTVIQTICYNCHALHIKGCDIEHISYLSCPPHEDSYVDHILYLWYRPTERPYLNRIQPSRYWTVNYLIMLLLTYWRAICLQVLDIMDQHASSFKLPDQAFKPRILKTEAQSRLRNLRVYHPPRRKSRSCDNGDPHVRKINICVASLLEETLVQHFCLKPAVGSFILTMYLGSILIFYPYALFILWMVSTACL